AGGEVRPFSPLWGELEGGDQLTPGITQPDAPSAGPDPAGSEAGAEPDHPLDPVLLPLVNHALDEAAKDHLYHHRDQAAAISRRWANGCPRPRIEPFIACCARPGCWS
ncbi:MAG TPA: hypothetical protein VGD99_11845, partial [Anaerolineae bacterium]